MKKKNKIVSKHYKKQRYNREKFIRRNFNGGGNIIDSFIIDKGHRNGKEIHSVTEYGVIVIRNARTNKLITKKIARPFQIEKLYATRNQKAPKWILELAAWHTSLTMNYL